MLTAEERLKRAAMSFGSWRERAHETKTMSDRKKFIRAESALGQAAQTFFEEVSKEIRRGKRRGHKS